MPKTYTTIHYIGGAEAGSWHHGPAYATRTAAHDAAAAVEQRGFPVLVHETEALHRNGLPEGAPEWWSFKELRRLAGRPGCWARRPRNKV